ncbi:MAG: hypothetical protein HQ591_00980 [candidate division Zixibacteria bacterium]|nr:hypothetical protein [Candidatus Tariuqbacter arcticus]
MSDISDIFELFVGIINNFHRAEISLDSPLEKMILGASTGKIVYLDNRRDAKGKYEFDFWRDIFKKFANYSEALDWLKSKGISEKMLYSKSDQFPDIVFKAKRTNGGFTCGSLLEMKDAKGSAIASFNSTLPTKSKSLKEVDIINGGNLVSRITAAFEEVITDFSEFYSYQRRCFYFVRTNKANLSKTKISLIDGSFFETIPTKELIAKTFLSIIQAHQEAKSEKLSDDELKHLESILAFLDNHNLISSSKHIDKASVKPRLRLMAEVHPEGNPHSRFYPEIPARSVNFIFPESDFSFLQKEAQINLKNLKQTIITHKRNGKYIVLQYVF